MARRQSYWDNSFVNVGVATGGVQVEIDLSGTLGAVSEGFTAVRTIFELGLISNDATPTAGIQFVDLGIGNVSKAAFGIGGTSLPQLSDPNDIPVGDWMWRTRCLVSSAGTVLRPIRCQGDMRGGRKLAGGTLFLAITNNFIVGTSFTVQVVGIVRTLILRP